MQTLNKKKLIIFLNILLFGLVLSLIPNESLAINFTAGWYEDHGGVQDNYCESGYWRATGEIKDYSGNSLVADKIDIRAIWYEDNGDTGTILYDETQYPSTSNFETNCIDTKGSNGVMVLEIIATKSGFHTIKSRNNVRIGGSALSRSTWSKTLHLAPLSTPEANISYLFPNHNQDINDDPINDQMKLYVNKSPRPEDINEIEVEIQHIPTGTKFKENISIPGGIDEGQVSFARPDFISELGENQAQGKYTWKVKSMTGNGYIFYNENESSDFYFDSVDPGFDYINVYRRLSGLKQAPSLYANAIDDIPYSGICKIEIYFKGYGESDYSLVKTCNHSGGHEEYCSWTGTYKEYTSPETHYGYFVAYDCAGNVKQTSPSSYTINPIDPNELNIRSKVGSSYVTGVPFDVTDVSPDNGNTPDIGNYSTNKEFIGYQSYHIDLKAPDSHNGKPFSFWSPNSSYCETNSKTLHEYVPFGYSIHWFRYMNFGATRLRIRGRSLKNQGNVSDDLDNQLENMETKIEQIGGTPELFGSSGYRYFEEYDYFTKNIYDPESMNNLTLRFHDSDDGVLLFSSLYDEGVSFNKISDRDYQGTFINKCGELTPRYSIKRTVEVQVWMGSVPLSGVNITGSGNMESGTTSGGGYYNFYSTDDPEDFTGSLTAPETITDIGGNEKEFGYWSGCDSVSSDGLTCYIQHSWSNPGLWYNNLSITVKANYTESGGPPNVDCGIVGDNTCVPGNPPWYCKGGTLIPCCSDGVSIFCGCPPGETCVDYGNGNCGMCWKHYDLLVNSNPINHVYIHSTDSTYRGWTNYSVTDIVSPPFGPPVIELTAMNNWGTYAFDKWEGCDTTTDVLCKVTMNEEKNVTANYIPTYFLFVASDPINNIPISGVDPENTSTDYGGNTNYIKTKIKSPPGDPPVIELTAPTSSGNYNFDRWEGCDTTTDVLCKVTIDSNRITRAYYVPVQPDAPDDLSEDWIDCSFKGLSVPVFNWNYYHPGGIPQSSAEIIIYGENDDLSYSCSGSCTSYTPTDNDWIRNNLLFGQNTYHWKVRVQDINGHWSDWSSDSYFTTRNHAHPWISFNWEPERPVVDQVTQFCSIEQIDTCEDEPSSRGWSECFGNSCVWKWKFPIPYSCASSSGCEFNENPLIKFPLPKDGEEIDLNICDPSLSDSETGKCCSYTKDINVALPLPEWEEIEPN